LLYKPPDETVFFPASPSESQEQVIPSDDTLALRQSLLHFLEAKTPNEEGLLERVEKDSQAGREAYSALLSILTHLSFHEGEARRHWRRVVAHRDLLRMELGRDPGLRVALLDYFANISHELRNPKVIEISIYERTAHSAITDGLTGLYNHAHFLATLKREVQRCRRSTLKLALVMFDLDNFKRLNDERGHVEGDRVLIKVAALVRESLRDVDLPARYGGEEFALILPDTSRTGAFVVAERIRKRIEDHFRRRRGVLPVTVSGGAASFPDDAQDVEELVRRADEGLYRSKAEGKNRITLVQGERRQHRRTLTSQRVTVEAGRRRRARTRNFSEGGLLLNLDEPVAVGTPVNVVIHPAGGPAVALRAEVVRTEAGGDDAFDVGVRLLTTPNQNPFVMRELKAAAPRRKRASGDQS
jgi:diguanylate cyclase (GGDEF)-like protein